MCCISQHLENEQKTPAGMNPEHHNPKSHRPQFSQFLQQLEFARQSPNIPHRLSFLCP